MLRHEVLSGRLRLIPGYRRARPAARVGPAPTTSWPPRRTPGGRPAGARSRPGRRSRRRPSRGFGVPDQDRTTGQQGAAGSGTGVAPGPSARSVARPVSRGGAPPRRRGSLQGPEPQTAGLSPATHGVTVRACAPPVATGPRDRARPGRGRPPPRRRWTVQVAVDPPRRDHPRDLAEAGVTARLVRLACRRGAAARRHDPLDLSWAAGHGWNHVARRRR